MRKFVWSLVAILTLSLALAGCGGGNDNAANNTGNNETSEPEKETAEPVKWVANSVWPPNNHHSEGLEAFAAKVKEATGGMVELEVKTGWSPWLQRTGTS